MPGGREDPLVEQPQSLGLHRLEVVRGQHHDGRRRQVLQVAELVEGVRQVRLRDGRNDLQAPRLGEEGVEHHPLLARGDRGPFTVGAERDDTGHAVAGEPSHVRQVGVHVDAEPVVLPERRHVRGVDAFELWMSGHRHLPRPTVWSRKASSSRLLGSPS
jgi:hypothetical protein